MRTQPQDIIKQLEAHNSRLDKEEILYSAMDEGLDEFFEGINTDSYFYMKKTIRKILRQIRIYSRYSTNKSTEVELLLYFCERLNHLRPSIHRNRTLSNLYERQIISIKKKISLLHEDLQYDYNLQLGHLKQN